MSLATASCDLWQNEQRSTSSEPVLVLTEKLLHIARCQSELRIPNCISRSAKSGQKPRCSCERAATTSGQWPACSRVFQCRCTMKLLNHNFDTLPAYVSAICVQLLQHHVIYA